MLLVLGLGLAKIFIVFPWVHSVLHYVSIIYGVYMAWRIATPAEAGKGRKTARPITFIPL